MKMRFYLLILLILPMMIGCQEDYKPKPEGFLALNFPKQDYEVLDIGCPYTFEVNRIATINPSLEKRPCMLDIDYPKMKGTIYITYEPVHDNLRDLLKDAQELPQKHTIKADQIYSNEYLDSSHDVYGRLYTVTGNAASQYQFYVTDSTAHFITGSVYFHIPPNYDSIYPAAVYLKEDMQKIMESVRWKN